MRETKNKSKSINRVGQRNAVCVATRILPSHLDANQIGKSEHFAQFYESDSFLLNSLTDFVRTGLRAGNAVVVIGTKARRHGLSESLRKSGLDLSGPRASD